MAATKSSGKTNGEAKAADSVLTQSDEERAAAAAAPTSRSRRQSAKPARAPKPKAPAEPITVNFTQLGLRAEPLELPAGANVGSLLGEVGLSLKEGTVLVNNKPATQKTRLKAGDAVVFSGDVEGGRC